MADDDDDLSRATAMSSLCTASSRSPKKPVEDAQTNVEPRNANIMSS